MEHKSNKQVMEYRKFGLETLFIYLDHGQEYFTNFFLSIRDCPEMIDYIVKSLHILMITCEQHVEFLKKYPIRNLLKKRLFSRNHLELLTNDRKLIKNHIDDITTCLFNLSIIYVPTKQNLTYENYHSYINKYTNLIINV